MHPGALTLTLPDSHTLILARNLSFQSFESSPAAKIASMNYWGGGINAKFENSYLHSRRVTIELTFTNRILSRISIFIHLDNDTADWSTWTLAQEMARKRAHEALALALFGVALNPKPIDINGKPILPLELNDQHPRHAVFPWGEITSGYDSKAGMAIMWISYSDPRA